MIAQEYLVYVLIVLVVLSAVGTVVLRETPGPARVNLAKFSNLRAYTLSNETIITFTSPDQHYKILKIIVLLPGHAETYPARQNGTTITATIPYPVNTTIRIIAVYTDGKNTYTIPVGTTTPTLTVQTHPTTTGNTTVIFKPITCEGAITGKQDMPVKTNYYYFYVDKTCLNQTSNKKGKIAVYANGQLVPFRYFEDINRTTGIAVIKLPSPIALKKDQKITITIIINGENNSTRLPKPKINILYFEPEYRRLALPKTRMADIPGAQNLPFYNPDLPFYTYNGIPIHITIMEDAYLATPIWYTYSEQHTTTIIIAKNDYLYEHTRQIATSTTGPSSLSTLIINQTIQTQHATRTYNNLITTQPYGGIESGLTWIPDSNNNNIHLDDESYSGPYGEIYTWWTVQTTSPAHPIYIYWHIAGYHAYYWYSIYFYLPTYQTSSWSSHYQWTDTLLTTYYTSTITHQTP